MSSDPRNALFNHYARLVSELNPKCFIFENVKAFKTMYAGKFKNEIIKEFSKLGYTVYETVLNAADFGIPQFRERVFIFGTKLKYKFSFPKRSHGNDTALLSFNTVEDAIMDISGLGVDFCENHF